MGGQIIPRSAYDNRGEEPQNSSQILELWNIQLPILRIKTNSPRGVAHKEKARINRRTIYGENQLDEDIIMKAENLCNGGIWQRSRNKDKISK